MPEEPKPSADDLVRMLLQLEAQGGDGLMQQMMDRLSQQTYVGGKRVAIEKLPRLPKQAATSVHRVKVSLYGARPPVWRRIEIPSAMRLDLVHEVLQVAFGWHGFHLHVFETVCGQFGAPDDDYDWPDRKDEATAALAQVAPQRLLWASLTLDPRLRRRSPACLCVSVCDVRIRWRARPLPRRHRGGARALAQPAGS